VVLRRTAKEGRPPALGADVDVERALVVLHDLLAIARAVAGLELQVEAEEFAPEVLEREAGGEYRNVLVAAGGGQCELCRSGPAVRVHGRVGGRVLIGARSLRRSGLGEESGGQDQGEPRDDSSWQGVTECRNSLLHE